MGTVARKQRNRWSWDKNSGLTWRNSGLQSHILNGGNCPTAVGVPLHLTDTEFTSPVSGLYQATGCHPNPRLEDNSISPTSSHVHCHSGHRKQVRNTSPQHNCCWGQGQIILSVGGGKSLSYCRASRAEDHEHKHYEEKQQTNCAKDTDVSGK